MGTNIMLGTALLVLLSAALSSGEVPYRWSRVLTGDGRYVYNTVPERYTYYTNPYTNYPSYKYVTPVRTYDNRLYSGSYPYSYYAQNPTRTYDDKVYITDKYGRTTVANSNSYYRAMSYTSGCNAGTCGQNAQCQVISGRPVCSCLAGYSGDPISYCKKAECSSNAECASHQTCQYDKCVNPCEGACGQDADCVVRSHVPVCTCRAGYTGDPFTFCRRFDPQELCHPSPCGVNTYCEVVNNVPTCKCVQGFFGSPLQGCRHECEVSSDCGHNLACIDNRCQNPCNSQCGENAICETVRDHSAVCKCPDGYLGNPYSACRAECVSHAECPSNKPACYNFQCKNPCDGVCGVGANCDLKNGITPVCSCPRDMTGDPFVRCRPFEKRDLCEPNPCGANAHCEPGYDRYNKERPVCTCLTGHTGDPIRGCVRGECTEDGHCADSQACIDYRCQNPCIGQCGTNAECTPRRHLAVCTCPQGYNGDALVSCREIPRAARRFYY